ncbi:hypothetical protein D9757_006850 [Collybiopsis confluens]|uniref:Uncharacterized protein n=1 Tax=Collybiopsis confluens TaxID=2823264 RepID=A0A8H5HQA4_9AGAR|nr:hypothetical protein D9757_006850 [Collybiopsis confluens]
MQMPYSDSDLDSNEFATSKSSTLVVSPGSEPVKGKRNISVAPGPQPPFLPHLQLQPLSFQANMFAGGNGKGPIQPHASNLPRRKLRRTAPAKKSKSISTSSTSIRTNAARSPHSIPTSPSPASVLISAPSYPPSFKDKPYFIDPEPTPSILAGVTAVDTTRPLLGSHSTPEPAISPLSKGHVQPHLSNVPRRKRQTLSQLTVKSHVDSKEAWIKRRCLQEVIKGSGIWIAFWDWMAETETEEESEAGNEPFVREVLSADRVIKVFSRLDGVENRESAELDADALKLFISPDPILQSWEDGMTRLSAEQIRAAKAYLDRCCSSQDCSCSSMGEHSFPPIPEALAPSPAFVAAASFSALSSSTPITRATRTAVSVSGPSSRSTASTPSSRFYSPFSDTPSAASPFTSLLSKMSSSSSSSHSNVDTDIDSDAPRSSAKRLMITVPSEEYAVDAITLVIVALSVKLKGVAEAMRKEEEVTALLSSSSSGASSDTAGQGEEAPVADVSGWTSDDESNAAADVSSSFFTPTAASIESPLPSPPPWSPTFDLLIRMHDFEDLGPSWRGALSTEGVEWLDEVVFLQ